MNSIIFRFYMVLGILAISGCGIRAVFIDISGQPTASNLIENSFVTQRDLLVYGITMARNYDGGVDYYTIKRPPGISGPEVIERVNLPKGTIVTVKKILKCKNCLFEDRIEAVVRVSMELNFERDVKISGLITKESNTGYLKLDPHFFSLIDSAN